MSYGVHRGLDGVDIDDQVAWVEIWRDAPDAPPELHDLRIFGDGRLELLPSTGGPFLTWEPGVSTRYACDSQGEALWDPTLWGDATVFWHVHYLDQHQCWVAGKHHERGKAMGCLSLHDTPRDAF